MASAFWFLFSGGGAVACLLVCAAWVLTARGSAAARRTLLALALAYALASTYAVSSALGRVLSAGYRPLQRADVPAGTSAIVLLGSGSHDVRDWSGTLLAVPDVIGLSRLLEAARLFTLLDPAWVISSGGRVVPGDRVRPSGQSMADMLVGLGVPASRILIEIESATTRDEAVIVKRMLDAHPTDHVVLVTSRIHMPRSVGAFRAVGVRPIPAIARDHASADTWWETVVPTDMGLREFSGVAHEVLGLGAYAVRGWYRLGEPAKEQ